MKYAFVLSSFLLLSVSSVSSVQAEMPAPLRSLPPQLLPRPTPPRMIVTQKLEQPIELRSVRISAEIAGGFAVTETEFEFYNPNTRALEGNLEFPLLENQRVSGFALDFDGKWRGAVPIEKPKAQQVFEDISRRKVDPAVLEQTQGNNYRVRVFPLPAQGTRKVRVQVSEKLGLDGSNMLYRLPLAFAKLPKFKLALKVENSKATVKAFDELGKIQLEAQDFDTKVLSFDKANYSGTGTLEVRIPSTDKAQSFEQNYAGQRYFMTVLPKPGGKLERRAVQAVDLLWDSSLSRLGRNLERENAVLEAYFKRFPNLKVRLIRFRNVLEPALNFTVVGGNWSALRAELEKTVYDGATNFDALNCAAVKGCAGVSERLLFTDGLDNSTLERLNPSKVPLYVLSSSVQSDPAKLKYLASGGGAFLDLTRFTAAQAAKVLLEGQPTLTNLRSSGARRLSVQEDAQNWYISGIRSDEAGNVTLEYAVSGKPAQTVVSSPTSSTPNSSTLVARQWAASTLEFLQGEADLNSGEIKRLGQAFGLVTPQTSLIVLDTVQDYVRYEVNPPAELEAEYKKLRQDGAAQVALKKRDHNQYVLGLLERYKSWWKTDFPKGKAPPLAEDKKSMSDGSAPAPEMASPAPAPMVSQNAPGSSRSSAEARATDSAAKPAGGSSSPQLSIALKKWTPDAPYIKRMQNTKTADLYRIYLDERPSYLESTAFFIDVADLMLERGLKVEGLRVLSNLAELKLENRAVLRILGYRYLQAKRPDLAVPVLEKVVLLAPYEPQSYRDLGLAYAQNKQDQKAIETLYEVVSREWDPRFAEVELIALNELNGIVGRSRGALNTRFMDSKLLTKLPLDVRVALTWDADNTDIDLWITDPNGEKVFYSHPLSYQGGRISKDMTGGYGPEEFTLKTAKKGKYRVEVDYYGNTQQIVAGAVTVQAKLITGFGSRAEREEILTLRLTDKKENVLVGEFEVK